MPRRGHRFVGVLFTPALVTLTLSTGCHHRGPIKPVKRTARASVAGPLSTAVVAPGIVEPWGQEVRVAAKEAGWIAEIRVREGQRVETGDVLARLDDGEQSAGVAAATAEVSELEALLRRAQRGPTAEEIDQARADRDAAAARAGTARSDAARLSLLMEEGLVSRARGEEAMKDAEAQAATEASFEARYAAALRGTRREDVAAASRRLEAARARLQAARAALARRVVSAPASGTVLWSRYRVGEFYAVGSQALFIVGDMSRLQVRVDVDEIDATRIALGAPVTIRMSGVPDQAGQVVALSPRMGRKNLVVEAPTSRNDVRIREVLVETASIPRLLPGGRVWVEFAGTTAS